FQNFTSFVHDFICTQPLVLFGDFNCPEIEWRTLTSKMNNPSHHSNSLLALTSSLSLTQCATDPTRGNNILDVVLTTHPHRVHNCRVLPPLPKLDHSLVAFCLDASIPRPPLLVIRDYRSANWDRIQYQIAAVDWDTLLAQSDRTPDALYSAFLNIIHPIINENVPYRKISSKPFLLSKKSQRLLRKSRKLFKQRFSIGLLPFKQASTKFRQSVRSTRRKRERDLISRPNSKRFYNFASDKLKNNASSIPALIDGASQTDTQIKVDLLAHHFSKCFNHNVPPPPPPPTLSPSDPIIDYIAFSPIIIMKILSKLPNRNSSSPDGIPYITCAYVDFSKAFDSIPLNLLVSKCESTGIRGGHRLKICPFLTTSQRFASFLSNRIVPHWNRLDDSIISS
ncbi:hypothetical protein PMAYCL1PPCAC_27279, partial [Pristionchus mayeri]